MEENKKYWETFVNNPLDLQMKEYDPRYYKPMIEFHNFLAISENGWVWNRRYGKPHQVRPSQGGQGIITMSWNLVLKVQGKY